MSKGRPPAHCAVCGAAIPARASACPEGGADERTGWREPDSAAGLDLPDETFDHEAFGEREGHGVPRRGAPLFWWVVASVMLALVVWLILRNLFWVAP